MKALVLDFDGVISDSARESFAVSLRSYLQLRPESELRERSEQELYRAFVDLMPLGNRAEDYGVVLTALERGRELADQQSYDAFRAEHDPAWLAEYHERFYSVRLVMSQQDPAGWLALMKPYRPLLEVLRRRTGEAAYAIATSKDRRSVRTLINHYRIDDLFPEQRIMDKELGARKTVHLKRLRDALAVDYAEMTFVDDKVNHLDAVRRLGVRCALATWGFNGPREHQLATRRGYLVCTLDNVEAQLFG